VTPQFHGAQWKPWGPALQLRSSDRERHIGIQQNCVTRLLHNLMLFTVNYSKKGLRRNYGGDQNSNRSATLGLARSDEGVLVVPI